MCIYVGKNVCVYACIYGLLVYRCYVHTRAQRLTMATLMHCSMALKTVCVCVCVCPGWSRIPGSHGNGPHTVSKKRGRDRAQKQATTATAKI